jgi:hypothetical protein
MEDSVIQDGVKAHLDFFREKYPTKDWFVIAAQGSMNYGMFDEDSDVDTKILTIPSLEDLALNKPPISHTLILDNNEHCDVKDIREYFKIVRKQNINFTEIFFTDYWLVNPSYIDLWLTLRNNAELITTGNLNRLGKCCYGMCQEKAHALCHPYPSKLHLLEKYGFDSKQLTHAMRMQDFLTDILEGKTFKESLIPHNPSLLMAIKRYKIEMSKTDAIEKMALVCDAVKDLSDKIIAENKDEYSPEADKVLNDTLVAIVKNSIEKE